MKRTFTLSLLLFIGTFLNLKGQTYDPDYKIPLDSSITKGVLPNGMTYYIKSTDVVKDAASFYIIQNVGSILENDDQKGLAHFLEHMAFNGTENFPGKGIINTLQKHGAVFGKDINAYTGFDETVYNLTNIPLKDGLVDTCLLILKDWSNYLSLTNEEIDAERGVIKEEWRTRQNGYMRLLEKSMPVQYNNSKYAERMPIGSMEVVENFDYKALRDFYHDWYRTDLQAIAIIGDVDVEEIENKIIEKFSVIPAVKNPKTRYEVEIPENNELMYSIGIDPEVSTASIQFGIRHKRSNSKETVADLYQSLRETMAIRILSDRLSEEAQKPDASFLRASLSYGGLSRTSNLFRLYISPKQNQQAKAFTDALTFIESANKFGYLESEVERTKVKILSSYQNAIAKRDDRSHARIERDIQNDFLINSSLTDIEKEFEIVKELLKDITPEEIHSTLTRLYSKKNRFINVTGVEGADNLTREKAQNIIKELENDKNIERYSEEIVGESLIDDNEIEAGSITEILENKDLNSTTYILSNGVKVHYKFSNKQKDQVALQATSYGGVSLLANEDIPSASMVTNLVQMSGLGDYSATELKKVLAGKVASVRPGIGGINESFSGGSNSRDVETMLQMLYLYFESPRFDEQAYEVLKSKIENYLVKKNNDVSAKMKDSLTVSLYGENNPRKPLLDRNYVNAISFEKIKSIYAERFGDVSDFEFYIVGDVKAEHLKPLLEKYIASLPTNNTSEHYKNNDPEWIANNIDQEIFLPMEDPKASVHISHKANLPYNLENKLHAQVLGNILQLRVTETVRESEGGAYSPRANSYLVREPESEVIVSFAFDCNPDLANKLVEIVTGELEKIANGTILENDLNKTKTNLLKEKEQAKNKNSYDMGMLIKHYKFGEPIAEINNFEKVARDISKEDIQELARKVLAESRSYKIVFKPEIN